MEQSKPDWRRWITDALSCNEIVPRISHGLLCINIWNGTELYTDKEMDSDH